MRTSSYSTRVDGAAAAAVMLDLLSKDLEHSGARLAIAEDSGQIRDVLHAASRVAGTALRRYDSVDEAIETHLRGP